MDNLTATSIAAAKSGMSYGTYVAKHGIIHAGKQNSVVSTARICPECGNEFSPVGRHIKAIYCSYECRYFHDRRVAMERYHERKKTK